MRGISPQFASNPFIGPMKIASSGHQKSEFFRPPLHLFPLRLIMGRMIVFDSFQPRLHKTGNEIVIILLSGMSQNRGSAAVSYTHLTSDPTNPGTISVQYQFLWIARPLC